MFYAVFLAIFLLSANADDQVEKCRKIFSRETFQCCSMRHMRPMGMDDGGPDELKECRDLQMQPPSCARDECIATKKGFYVDGKIDFDAFTKLLEKNMAAVPEILSLIKEKCLKTGVDLSNYGRPEMCDLFKLKDCLLMQSLKNCPEWSDRDNCKEIKTLVEDCSSIL